MAFVRLKKVAGKTYASLVENTWTVRGPRQKVVSYLGKCIALEDVEQPPAAADRKALVAAELAARGFDERLTRGKVRVNLSQCTVREGKRRVTLSLNGGFLCDYTLRKLLAFEAVTEATPGYALARAFSDAGIRVGREQFVAIYKKLYNTKAA